MFDGCRHTCTGTGLCQPPAKILVCLELWGDDALRSVACRNISAFLFVGLEAFGASKAFYFMILPRYVVFIRRLARRVVRVCCFASFFRRTVPVCFSCLLFFNKKRMHLLLGATELWLHNATSYDRYENCRTVLFSTLLDALSFVISQIVDFVRTEELDHLSIWLSSCRQRPRIVGDKKEVFCGFLPRTN